jgi:hypothetical protein
VVTAEVEAAPSVAKPAALLRVTAAVGKVA